MNRATTIAVLAAAVLAVPAAARADVLRLANGKSLHGVVERGFIDEQSLKVRLFATGGVVRVRWDHLIPEDRRRWQEDLGLLESEESQSLRIEGHKVTFTNGTFRFGLILNPEALADPKGVVQFHSEGKLDTYERGAVGAVEPARLELAQAYTPEQAYQARLKEIGPNNGYAHYEVAEYARKVGAYDRAREHYLEAKKDAEFASTPDGRTLDSKVAKMDILLKNRELQGRLEEIKRTLILAGTYRMSDFRKAAAFYQSAREKAYKVMQDVKDPELQKELRIPEIATRAEAERRTFFERALAMEVSRRITRLAEGKAKEKKVRDIPPGLSAQDKAQRLAQGTFDAARQWATRQGTEDLVRGLLDDLGFAPKKPEEEKKAAAAAAVPADTNVATVPSPFTEENMKKDLLDYWEHRKKNTTTTTSYGYGTFIVVKKPPPPAKKPPPPPPANPGGRNQPRQPRQPVQAAPVQPVKPMTSEEWWDKEETTAHEKAQWLLSYWAERSKFVEVVRGWEDLCKDCAGLGFKIASIAATGETEQKLCTTCNGIGCVRKVKWQ